ncbi:MAG: glycosyltransferase family 4 protein [Muribaculaceae bacterium]|nr:glycosyltransferase family 4 protein [Muribaculaceae bacterium]
MKVLYIASGTGIAGGATKSFIAMICQAQIHGIDFEVVCPNENGLTQWLRDRNIKVHVVPFRHVRLPYFNTMEEKIKWLPRVVHDFWINFRARSGVKRIAKEYAPDLVHENSSVINVGYYASKSIGVPDIVHIREYGYLDFRLILPGRKSRLKSPHVSSISITKDIQKHLKQDSKDNAIQIYDGIVRTSDFRINEDKQRWFLYAGRIEPAKSIEDLLHAYVEYVKSVNNPIPLYVCGGCDDPAFLENMKLITVQGGVNSKVVWLGERADVADFMYDAAATIIPSRFEGLGRVMPEAMANGSLCVAKYTGGTKEQLDNGLEFTGAPIAIAYEEKPQLVDALAKITEIFDKGGAFLPGTEFRNMIDRAQSSVKEFFSEESFGNKIIDFYNKILSDKK